MKVARGFFFFALRLLAVQATLAAGGSGRLKRPEQPACPISRLSLWKAVLAAPERLSGPTRLARPAAPARPAHPNFFIEKKRQGETGKCIQSNCLASSTEYNRACEVNSAIEGAGNSISIFGNTNHHFPFISSWVVIVVAIQEHDNISIFFNSP